MSRPKTKLILIVLVGVAVTACGDTAGRDSYETRLITAVQSGVVTDVQSLLDEGADANEPNSAGITPIEVAIEAGDPAIVKVLLAAGAHTARTSSGGSFLALAATSAAVSYATVKVADTRSIEIVELLIAAGVDPCARTDLGDGRHLLPSEIAAERGRPAVAEILAHHEQLCTTNG